MSWNTQYLPGSRSAHGCRRSEVQDCIEHRAQSTEHRTRAPRREGALPAHVGRATLGADAVGRLGVIDPANGPGPSRASEREATSAGVPRPPPVEAVSYTH